MITVLAIESILRLATVSFCQASIIFWALQKGVVFVLMCVHTTQTVPESLPVQWEVRFPLLPQTLSPTSMIITIRELRYVFQYIAYANIREYFYSFWNAIRDILYTRFSNLLCSLSIYHTYLSISSIFLLIIEEFLIPLHRSTVLKQAPVDE